MSFSLARVRAVLWKDLLELRKNRGMLWSMLALPTVIVLVPIGVVRTYVMRPDDPNLRAVALYYDLTVNADNAARFLVDKVLADWFVLYLVMPVFVPILISSHAVAGEKEKRTLEPLLSSPVTPLELVIGKSLASLIPSVIVCLIAFSLALNPLGFLLSSIPLMLLLLRLVDPVRWPLAVPIAVLVPLGMLLILKRLLLSQFPSGIFEILSSDSAVKTLLFQLSYFKKAI